MSKRSRSINFSLVETLQSDVTEVKKDLSKDYSVVGGGSLETKVDWLETFTVQVLSLIQSECNTCNNLMRMHIKLHLVHCWVDINEIM